MWYALRAVCIKLLFIILPVKLPPGVVLKNLQLVPTLQYNNLLGLEMHSNNLVSTLT